MLLGLTNGSITTCDVLYVLYQSRVSVTFDQTARLPCSSAFIPHIFNPNLKWFSCDATTILSEDKVHINTHIHIHTHTHTHTLSNVVDI